MSLTRTCPEVAMILIGGQRPLTARADFMGRLSAIKFGDLEKWNSHLDSIRTKWEQSACLQLLQEARHVRILTIVRRQPLRAGLRSCDRDVRWKHAQHHQGADHGQRI